MSFYLFFFCNFNSYGLSPSDSILLYPKMQLFTNVMENICKVEVTNVKGQPDIVTETEDICSAIPSRILLNPFKPRCSQNSI